MLLRSIAVLALLAVLAPGRASACSCVNSGPLCNADFDAMASSGVVFVGRVVATSSDGPMQLWQDAAKQLFPDAADPQELMQQLQAAGPDRQAEFARLQMEQQKQEKLDTWGEFMTEEERQAVLDADQKPGQPDLDFKWYGRKIQVEVVERLVGKVEDTVYLKTGFGGGDCGIHFELGQDYLVNTGESSNGLYSVGICGGTAHVRYHQDTLAALRAWKKGEPRPRIVSGRLQDWTSRADSHPRGGYPPMEGVEVFLRSDKIELKTVTDADGAFRFVNVPRAQFRVEPNAPGYGPTKTSREPGVDMTTNSCSSLFLALRQEQASIRGRVLPQPGDELPEALWIEAVPADDTTVAPFDGTARNEDGRFAIDEIEPGRFYVAVNAENAPTGPHNTSAKYGRVWPYPTTYYPGVSDRAKAAVFEVQRGQSVDVGEWLLPARLEEVAVPGRVLLPDGPPAADVRLILRRPGRAETISQIGPTSSDGTFAVHLLETIEYEIEAVARIGDKVYRGVVVPGAERPAEIVIQLELGEPRPTDAVFFGFAWDGR